MKKVFLGLIGLVCLMSVGAAASEQHIIELANGDMQFKVTYSEPKDYVEVFVRKNEQQVIAQNITNSMSVNGDGTYTYQLIHGGFVAGDLVAARFYSHLGGVQEFTPVPFLPGFVSWGRSLIYTNPVGGSPYITELGDGDILISLESESSMDYVEVFVRKNGVQLIAQEITANYDASTGIYSFVNSGYQQNDEIEVRFYAHSGGSQSFFPGAGQQVWSKHKYGAYGNTTFTTQDGTYTLGLHEGLAGEPLHTEVYFDIGFEYLTPFSSASGPAASWILDRALAQSFYRDYLLDSVEFKGLYVRNCFTGEWVNVDNTVYAPMQALLYLGVNSFSVGHYYSNIVTNELMDTDFACPGSPVRTQVVSVNGAPETVLSVGRVHFAYVVQHH